MTDTEILDWLEANCSYMEHGKRDEDDCYWPHTNSDTSPNKAYIGLTLRQYVEARATANNRQ